MNIDRTTTTLRALLATTAVAAALMLSAPSFAADQAASPQSSDTAKTKMGHHVEARIADLHKKLGITAAQEPQWSAVAQVMRDNANAVSQLVNDRKAKSVSMTAPDDLRSYEAITDAHADGLKKLVPAFDALYATLSDDQKKTADSLFRHVRKPLGHKA